MSIFNELLPKFNELSKSYSQNFEINLKKALEVLDKFGDDYKRERGRGRETQRPKPALHTLQSIHEDEASDDNNKPKRKSSVPASSTPPLPQPEPPKRPSKRSKHEVDGMSSPEQDKRQKRNASVRAQNNITKQVNVSLNQKMRREDTADESKRESRSRRRGGKEDKENDEPLIPPVNIKKEKISLPEDPMQATEPLVPDVEVKQERDVAAMPPPSAPVSRPRRGKEKVEEVKETDDAGRKSTRAKKNENMPPPEVPAPRPTRASSRANSTMTASSTDVSLQAETRPKRTRAKKKQPEPEPDTEKSQESAQSSPAEKSRPKRTRRGQKKAVDDQPPPKPEDNTNESPPEVTPVQTTESLPKTKLPKKIEVPSPILPSKIENVRNERVPAMDDGGRKMDEGGRKLDETTTVAHKMDETVTLHNGVLDGVDSPRKAAMNETIVLETVTRKTVSMDSAPSKRMDETVVLSKGTPNVTDDDSLMTDDMSDVHPATPQTPPKQDVRIHQPTSAVKVKVQQFEELASRVTRTKTRAMAKKEENENQTPPDNVIPKAGISADTLKKMNNLIFNGKVPQVSSSACKPRAPPVKQPTAPSTASKATALARQKEAAEESMKKEKEDARKKKEALLEAKREMHKRKREEKMAAAAAAREAAERERLAMIEAAQKDRQEKMAHAEQEKVERMKEAERKKQEVARKAAEIEERRRAEEGARQQRLADEQKRADVRKKQQEEAEAMKKEAAIMAKEVEKKQKEYIERQKMKERQASKGYNTPLKVPGTPSGAYGPPLEPVYMKDGFQYLNSDSDSDETKAKIPVPAWSTSKARKHPLRVQSIVSSSHVDRLFSVRRHSPDLREIFPNIDRRALKRTSSAVWRTPPGKLPVLTE